jgi:hypothetical protein
MSWAWSSNQIFEIKLIMVPPPVGELHTLHQEGWGTAKKIDQPESEEAGLHPKYTARLCAAQVTLVKN